MAPQMKMMVRKLDRPLHSRDWDLAMDTTWQGDMGINVIWREQWCSGMLLRYARTR